MKTSTSLHGQKCNAVLSRFFYFAWNLGWIRFNFVFHSLWSKRDKAARWRSGVKGKCEVWNLLGTSPWPRFEMRQLYQPLILLKMMERETVYGTKVDDGQDPLIGRTSIGLVDMTSSLEVTGSFYRFRYPLIKFVIWRIERTYRYRRFNEWSIGQDEGFKLIRSNM
jgi:hypothetical protein